MNQTITLEFMKRLNHYLWIAQLSFQTLERVLLNRCIGLFLTCILLGLTEAKSGEDPPYIEDGSRDVLILGLRVRQQHVPDPIPPRRVYYKGDLVRALMPQIKDAWANASIETLAFPERIFESSIRTCPYTWGIFGPMIIPELVKAKTRLHQRLPIIENFLHGWSETTLKKDIPLIREWVRNWDNPNLQNIVLIIHIMKHFQTHQATWKENPAQLKKDVMSLSKL